MRSSTCSTGVCSRLPNRSRGLFIACAANKNPRTEILRQLLQAPGVLQGPCCHDGLSARLIEAAGFPLGFMSGFCTSAARLGQPDTGLISYGEMVDQGRYVNEATQRIPIIGDGDAGYGNALNVKRTVKGYAAAGFAGILIEDQVAPKSCGHVRGKRVVSREEAVSRIRAAVDAREEGSDILIFARTDARQAQSIEEALWRAAAFADAGADVLFIDALESRQEMKAFCSTAQGIPKMANNLEGGKTPILGLEELSSLGFKLVAYPLSLLGVSIAAMQSALQMLKDDKVPEPPMLPSFAELQDAIGFPEYFREEARYAVSLPTLREESVGTSGTSATESERQAPVSARSEGAPDLQPEEGSSSSSSNGAQPMQWPPERFTIIPDPDLAAESAGQGAGQSPVGEAGKETWSGRTEQMPGGSESASKVGAGLPDEYVEADVVIPPSTQLVTTDAGKRAGANEDSSRKAGDLPSFIRLRITNISSGRVSLETRIPANFLSGIMAIVPQVAGLDVEGLVRSATGNDNWSRDKPVADFENNGDRIEVFLE